MEQQGSSVTSSFDRLRQQAGSVDDLTGLPSIADFYLRAKSAIEDADSDAVEFSIVYFNIENMKLYNERFGMAAGDELLIFTAGAIEQSFQHALVSRIGDDRFVLLTFGDDLESGIELVCDKVASHNDRLRVGIRVGVYGYDGTSSISLSCDRAKLACDHIKGRYDVSWYRYNEDLQKMRDRRQYILSKFDEAMREGYIQVHFQPILRVIDTNVTEFEALARWIDPENGFISPGEFIPVLEEARLVHAFDLHIIEMVCEQYSFVMEHGFPIAPANVNLSRLDMELCDIVEETRKLMDRYGVPADMINIEITESAFSRNSELLRQTIDRFHEIGVKVWMDDFGSGYSSLNVLREYPFDVVKFDMSFLRHSDEESRRKSREMLPHIVTMVKALGFQTLAEGVETQEQFDVLKDIGCEKVQGYLFAKPSPVGEFAARIASGEFGVETMNRQAYMDKVGRVDLMAPSAIDRGLSESIGLSTGLPAAIVEFKGNTVRYLAWNSSYLDYLRDIGMNTIENSTKQMNDLTRPQSQGFFGAAAKMRGVYEWLNIAFYEGDDLCTGRARCIAVDDESDTSAFVYIAFNVSRFLAQAGHTLPKATPVE